MQIVIGTDEAGYGPNLGPLVVGATLWQIPDDADCEDLYHLTDEVIHCAESSARSTCGRLPIGDSKSLFKSRGSIGPLQNSVLTMLGTCSSLPVDLFGLLQELTGQEQVDLAQHSTYHWTGSGSYEKAERESITQRAREVDHVLTASGIKCDKLAASMVFPPQFNRGVREHGNKATLLTSTTCQLARRLTETIDVTADDEPVRVTLFCDKHGGRSRYAGLLQQEMTDSPVRVIEETRERSHYRWRQSDIDFEVRFLARGEQLLPVALASMVAKYLRELSMEAWNAFWREHMPALKPTAGYPQDARRFKSEIESLQARLQVTDDLIWRNR